MSTESFDERFYRDEPDRIRAQGFTREELLEEFRRELRSCKQMWDNYRYYQDPNRGQFTAEDIAEAEQSYKEFKNDTAEIYEYDDILDALVKIRGTGNVMNYVISKGVKEGPLGNRRNAAPAAQQPARNSPVGAIIWLAIAGVILFLIFR